MEQEKPGERFKVELYDRISSEFYDYHAKRGDIPFFVNNALESGGPVLEIGCGTGRVLIPTARSGIPVTGLDLSAEMLAVCRGKIQAEPEAVRSRIHLVEADMRDFSLTRQFPLATITFGPFNNLISVEDQLSCLNCIHRHLTPGGRLIFDVMFCQPSELMIREKTAIVENQDPFLMSDGRSVTWSLYYDYVDYHRQIIYEELRYDIRHPDGRMEQLSYPEELRFFFRWEIEHLLARAHFSLEALFADFSGTPFDGNQPGELIIAARKDG